MGMSHWPMVNSQQASWQKPFFFLILKNATERKVINATDLCGLWFSEFSVWNRYTHLVVCLDILYLLILESEFVALDVLFSSPDESTILVPNQFLFCVLPVLTKSVKSEQVPQPLQDCVPKQEVY